MTNLISIILSLVILLVLIYIKDIQGRKHRTKEFGPLYFRLRKISRLLLIISILLFFLACFIDVKTNYYDRSWLSFITIVINALSVALITLPISISNLYSNSLKERERISYTKYVVTSIYDLKSIYKLNKAGINVIILTEDDIKSRIKTVEEKDFNRRLLNSNLIIKTSNKNFLKDLENAYHENRSLNKAYEKIRTSRGTIDNIVRTIKYNYLIYLPILLLYLDLILTGFPVLYNILVIMFIKLITTIASEYVYSKMPYDSDLMERRSFSINRYIGKQEILFIIFTSVCALFCFSLPYQHIIYESGTNELALTIFLSSLLFYNIFITYCLYSEHSLIKNFIHSIKNLRVLIFACCLFIITILINFIHILGTKNVGFQNYFITIIFGLIPVLIIEIVKFARFITVKRVKNENKNYKKHQRS